MGVFAHNILVKESVCVLVWSRSQANKESIEILQHLPPLVVNGTVALVYNDKIEELWWIF